MAKTLGSLAVGDTIEVPVKAEFQSYLGTSIVFKVADKNHEGYPVDSVTLITDKIPMVLAFDAAEPNNSDADRKTSGNNRYLHSNLLQWLNSNAVAGTWYSAQHTADQSPSSTTYVEHNPYSDKAGFLAMLDDNFVAALMDTTVKTAKNTVTDGGGSETVTSKIFLASTTEVGLANDNIAEGARLALFTTEDTSRLAYPSAECVSNSRYTDTNFKTSKAWDWWLRTPNSGISRTLHATGISGNSTGYYAYRGSKGVRPLCNLSSSILVNDAKNINGNYEIYWNKPPSTPIEISVPPSCVSNLSITVAWGASTDPESDAITYILERSYNGGTYEKVTETANLTFTETVSTSWNTLQYRVKALDIYRYESAFITSSEIAVTHNQPPVITGQDTDLGAKAEGFTHKYTVTDPENDIIAVVEAVDGKTLRTYTPTLGQENTLTVAGHDFTALANAQHTITITATDPVGNVTTRTLTFTKLIKNFTVTLAQPLDATVQPRRANIFITRDIPAGGTFKVETTNNPYDPSPVWEDCTNAVLKGVAHVFTNTINTAVQYGMNIRVTVERGTALSPCWVSSIGGNFE